MERYQAAAKADSTECRAHFRENAAQYYAVLGQYCKQLNTEELPETGLDKELLAAIEAQPLDLKYLNATLRTYQTFGVKYAIHQKRTLLGDEMGLGKTFQAMATLAALKAAGKHHFMVVCPASVLINWCRELQKHTQLEVTQIHGGDETQLRHWRENGDVAVTTYESISRFDLPEKFKFDALVVDEAHYVKNPEAQRTVAMQKLLAKTEYVLYMSGTPLVNRVEKLLQLIEEAQTATDEFFRCARLDCRLDEHKGCVRLRQPEWTQDILSPALHALECEVKQMAQVEENEVSRAELMDIVARLLSYRNTTAELVRLSETDTSVYWAESEGQERQYTNLRSALINVADVLREKLFETGNTCICTSATLSTGTHGMQYFAGRVGAESAETLQIGSPFNFAEQMRVVVARSMPPPPPASDEAEYRSALFGWITRALTESDGRAFVLFTSYNLLREMAPLLRPFCTENGWPLLVQGDGPDRTAMLRQFRDHIGSVLLGTDSFWTGVDVPGEAPKFPSNPPATPSPKPA